MTHLTTPSPRSELRVELTGERPEGAGADVIALAAGGAAAARIAPRAALAADPVALVHPRSEAEPLTAVLAVEPGLDGLRTAAARAVRTCPPGGTVAWLWEGGGDELAQPVAALAEGAALGAYDGRRWGSGPPPAGLARFVVCAPGVAAARRDAAAAALDRAVRVARWCNVARELVDAPSNLMSPEDLAARAEGIPGVTVEVIDAAAGGFGGLRSVGDSGRVAPRMIVVRHRPGGAPVAPRLALVGKAVTFDSGGYFLKPQATIVRQKADMGGGAAVLGALGAIAELGLGLSVTGIVPACENLIGATATRPGDVITTAAGLTVEVINPDAEGRLILADALWHARSLDATHIVDLATLTGAQQAGMGDVYGGVFSPEPRWRDAVVAAGDAAGDLAWPWPMHPRYRRLLESRVADLRNVGGVGFGYPIFAATFLERFAGDGPWAHVDMLGPAFLTEDRGDAFAPGATGYGVRMLTELATRLASAS